MGVLRGCVCTISGRGGMLPNGIKRRRKKKMWESATVLRFFSYLCSPNQKNYDLMSRVTLHDKTFETSIPEREIQQRVQQLAQKISADFADKNPLLLAVLNGSFIFAADLMRAITIPCEISFVKLASYQGTTSSGQIKEVMGINEDLTGRHVIIVEDIVDTGLTMKRMVESLGTRRPASISICTLLIKPDKLQVALDIDYAAFRIPNAFIVGYGLDYDQQGRGLRDIYTLV